KRNAFPALTLVIRSTRTPFAQPSTLPFVNPFGLSQNSTAKPLALAATLKFVCAGIQTKSFIPSKLKADATLPVRKLAPLPWIDARPLNISVEDPLAGHQAARPSGSFTVQSDSTRTSIRSLLWTSPSSAANC